MREDHDADLSDMEIVPEVENAARHQDDVVAPIEGATGGNQCSEIDESGRPRLPFARLIPCSSSDLGIAVSWCSPVWWWRRQIDSPGFCPFSPAAWSYAIGSKSSRVTLSMSFPRPFVT